MPITNVHHVQDQLSYKVENVLLLVMLVPLLMLQQMFVKIVKALVLLALVDHIKIVQLVLDLSTFNHQLVSQYALMVNSKIQPIINVLLVIVLVLLVKVELIFVNHAQLVHSY